MLRLTITACLVALGLLNTCPAFAQADVAGEWSVEFSSSAGSVEFTMFVIQDGSKLSGRLSSSSGEFPLRGSVVGDRFTIIWSIPVDGNVTEITFTGIVKGDSLSGRAKVGNLAEGPLYGERTGR